MGSTVIPILVLAALLGPAAATSPAASTLLFDATLTRQGGVLRDGHRQPIGHFSLACTKTRCAGLARTADGRLRFTGPAGAHAWAVRGVSGAYRGAHGRFQVRDITDREWLITMTVTPRSALHVALVRRFASNARFVARADRACAGASRQLAALPAFPFSDFDPLHPNAALLPQVGAYFTGPGDPRPALRKLVAELRALGEPPANRSWWTRVLESGRLGLAVRERQDVAALAGHAEAFAQSAREAQDAFWRLAISATEFGTPPCIF